MDVPRADDHDYGFAGSLSSTSAEAGFHNMMAIFWDNPDFVKKIADNRSKFG